MRSNKELLEILLIGVKTLLIRRKCTGMCGVITCLYRSKSITNKEAKQMYNLIHEHKPDNTSAFFFKPYRRKPRIKFLKELIKLL